MNSAVSRHPRRQTSPRQTPPPGLTPPSTTRYGQQAGSTHSTGICFIICFHDKNSHLERALDAMGFGHKSIMVVFDEEDLLSG